MTAALLYIFLFSTWGMGLLTWLILIAIKVQNSTQDTEMHKLVVQSERMKIADDMISQVRQRMGPSLMSSPQIQGNNELSSKLQELIKTAGRHPEVGEIDHNDLIIGVRFEGEDYPPTVDDDDDDEG
jgi:hypothetical protein